MNKTYDHDHTEKRARIAYEENMKYIKEHNEAAQKGKYSFEIRANNLADLTQSSYLKRFVRLKEDIHPESIKKNASSAENNEDHEALLGSARYTNDEDDIPIPESIDWRQIGFRTKPMNQLTCGSCYAFSIATVVEAQVFKRIGKLVRMSPQQIVDCSSKMGNGGCSGGSLRTTLKYLKATKGLMRNVDYPYQSAVSIISILYL